MTIGFRVLQRRRAVPDLLVTKYRGFPVANVSDSMHRISAGGSRLRPMHAGGPLCGPAITVRTRPGDNLLVHAALDLAIEGDVIVVDAGGDLTNAIFGEMMLATAIQKKLGGIVINGAIRDYAAIHAGTFPVFAAGITHRGPYKDGPGEVNVSIAVDGMTVEPGDLVIGDDDGVLSVPFDVAEEVYVAALAKNEAERHKAIANSNGTSDRSHLRDRLISLGAVIEV
jgi:regulator of RNase E activity RraA